MRRMKHTQGYANSNRTINRKYAKCYRHNVNIITFLKSNYKYKRRGIRHPSSNRQRQQWHLPYCQGKQNRKHKLSANEKNTAESKQIDRKISFYETIKLDNFLRIYILIMQQAIQTSSSNNNNYCCINKSENGNSRSFSRLVAKLKAINNANNKSVTHAQQEEENENENENESGIVENHRAYKDANKDTDIKVDISNIAAEISYQQHNYDKVSTITSTPIKCQRRKHHQIKRTNSTSSLSSKSATVSLTTTTTAKLTMSALLSAPSIQHYETCQWTAILRHYVREHPSIHKPKYTPHTNSLTSTNNSITNSGSSRWTKRASAIASIYQSVDQYVNATWNRSYTLSCLLLTLFIAFTIGVPSTTAGACWQTVLDNGKCNEIFSLNISKSECCGANQEFAYTEREPTNVEYFFATAIGGGMECSPCLESCMNVKCGPNKKCVKRKGRPKCVCAPECGAARRKRKQRENFMQQEQQPNRQIQHHPLHLINSHAKGDNNKEDDDDGYYQDVPSLNAFKIKIEKSQQSRDTRSLSSEITNVNLGLENGKDVMISSGISSPVERHHCKEYNQSQRKHIHTHMHHSHEHRQQEQFIHQPNYKKQEPKGSRRLLITANVEHTEKPTTRRLQIFSNVRTTQHTRRLNSNSNRNKNKNKYGQHEDTDPSDYYEHNDENYNYNDAEDDAKEAKKKSSNIDIGNSNKNNRNDDSKRFLSQSPSRHKLKTNIKPNNSNNKNKNKNRNKSQHELQTTKIRQHSNNNNTRAIHPQQNGRHAEHTPHHRHNNHNHHSHHIHRQHHRHHQQQQEEEQQLQQEQEHHQQHNHHHNNHRQQIQNHGRHNKHNKHNNSNKQHHKQQTNVLKKPKNNKDYNITTASITSNNNSINNTSIAVVNTATTTTTARDNNTSNTGTHVTAIDASTSALPQTEIATIATTATSSNLSLSSAATTTTQPNSSPQDTQSHTLLLLSSSSSTASSVSSTTPLNSTMSADDGAAADDHYRSRLPNHGSEIVASSLLSAALLPLSFPLPSPTPTPSSSSSSSSYLQISAVSARSPSESSVVTTMSATGEGVSHLDHYHHTEIPTHSTHNSKNNNSNNDVISALQSNLNNNQQHQQDQQQQQQTQPHPHTQSNHYQTPLFDAISEQFDLIQFPNNKQQQRITDGENVRPLNPVCGTDGRTYNTECQLRKRACRTDNPNLQIAYFGHCRTTCNGVKCLNGLTCVEDQYAMPHCIACKIECLQDDYDNDAVDATRAVCGADGKTYKSICDINRMICKIGRSIGVAYPGPCRGDQVTCDDINCGPKQVCLIDLLTHKPRCTSCRYKCSRKRRPSSPHFDEGKICGFNNRTYNSWCEMRKDSCSTGFYIDVKYAGDCH